MLYAIHTALQLLIFTICFNSNIVNAQDLDSDKAQIKQVKELARKSNSRLLEKHHVQINELWQDWHTIIAEVSKRQLQQDSLPPKSIHTFFTEDQASNLSKINHLTEKLLLNLKGVKSQALKKNYFELKTRIEQYKKEMIADTEDQFAAPNEAEAYFWQTHKKDYQELIQRKEKAIQGLKEDQAQLIKDSHAYLIEIGIQLTEEQVEQLFKRSTSDLMLNLLVTFSHLNMLIELVSDRLQETRHQQSYVERATYYYSIYVGLVSLSLDLHRMTRKKLEKNQIPKIKEVFASLQSIQQNTNRILTRETREVGRGIKSKQQENREFIKQLKQNLQIQSVTLTGIQAYQKYLQQQINQIKSIEEMIARRLAVAFNTYQTVHVSQKFLTLVESGLKDLHNIRTIQIPAMLPIEQTRFVKVFDAVDRHLQGDINLVKSWNRK